MTDARLSGRYQHRDPCHSPEIRKWEGLRDLAMAGCGLGCSAITIGEIYAGMRVHEKERTEEFLSRFKTYEVTAEIARYAGLLKNEWQFKGRTLFLDHTLIAATALAHRLVLITDNRKDFPMAEILLHPVDQPPMYLA